IAAMTRGSSDARFHSGAGASPAITAASSWSARGVICCSPTNLLQPVYCQSSPRISPPLGVQAWYHVRGLIVGDKLRTLPSAMATFIAACAVDATCQLQVLGLGCTWNFEVGPESQPPPRIEAPPPNTAESVSPGKLSSESFTSGGPF